MSKKGYKAMSETEFNGIKALQMAGLSISVVTKATKRGSSTVGNIFHSNDFNDYKRILRESAAKYAAKPQAAEPPTLVPLPPEPVKLETQLERIAVAIERLADAWENTSNKRKLF